MCISTRCNTASHKRRKNPVWFKWLCSCRETDKDTFFFFFFLTCRQNSQTMCILQKENLWCFFLFLEFSWVVFPIMLLRKPEINLKSKKDISQVRQSWRPADVLWLTSSFQVLLACRRAKPHTGFPMSLAVRVGKSVCLYHRQRQWGFTGWNIPRIHTLCTR